MHFTRINKVFDFLTPFSREWLEIGIVRHVIWKMLRILRTALKNTFMYA